MNLGSILLTFDMQPVESLYFFQLHPSPIPHPPWGIRSGMLNYAGYTEDRVASGHF